MINFQEIKDTVQAHGLQHKTQLTQFDCSRACLIMLAAKQKEPASIFRQIPAVIPTREMPLYAARHGVYLEPVNPISTGVPHGFLLCLRRNHWYIMQINDFDVIVYDPLWSDALHYDIGAIPTDYSDDISLSFIVHFAELPALGESHV